mgnify:CR=1 FL=1
MELPNGSFVIFSVFSGFLSKDAILAGTLSFAQNHPIHFLLPVFGFSAAAITAFYMFRLIFLTFHGEPKMPKVFEGIHESPSLMTAPLVILAALSTYIFYTLPINLIPWKDYGWFTKLIKAKDSAVTGSPPAKEIYDGGFVTSGKAIKYIDFGGSVGVKQVWCDFDTQDASGYSGWMLCAKFTEASQWIGSDTDIRSPNAYIDPGDGYGISCL